MIKLMIAALLTTTIAVAQTAPQNAKGGAAKGASTTTKSTSASKTPASGTSAKPTAASPTEPSRPLPEHSLKTKLKNDNTNNPYYNLEKDKSKRGAKREYSPSRTKSGARKDTMDQRKL
jgi:hypothetical protein